MAAFRFLLVIMVASVAVYTGVVVVHQGWNLFPVFFGDMAAFNWPGQFNLDFTCFLTLSGLWLAWRHHFSPGGLALGMLGFFGGIMVLAPFLLIASFQAKGDMNVVLLGKVRASS